MTPCFLGTGNHDHGWLLRIVLCRHDDISHGLEQGAWALHDCISCRPFPDEYFIFVFHENDCFLLVMLRGFGLEALAVAFYFIIYLAIRGWSIGEDMQNKCSRHAILTGNLKDRFQAMGLVVLFSCFIVKRLDHGFFHGAGIHAEKCAMDEPCCHETRALHRLNIFERKG